MHFLFLIFFFFFGFKLKIKNGTFRNHEGWILSKPSLQLAWVISCVEVLTSQVGSSLLLIYHLIQSFQMEKFSTHYVICMTN